MFKEKWVKILCCAVLLFVALFVIVKTVPTDSLSTKAGLSKTTYNYKAEKVKTYPKELMKDPFGSVKASPNVTISLTSTKSIARTYSVTANIGVTIDNLNASLGWSKSKTDTVSVSNAASWKVPTKVSGKKVKYGYLKGYVYLDKVGYKIKRQKVVTKYFSDGDIISITKYSWEDYKSGIATRARVSDVVYKKSYTYK